MNNTVQCVTWEPPKPQEEKGPWRLDVDTFMAGGDMPQPKAMLVRFGPNDWAANHYHETPEVLICLAGSLYLVWRDADGNRHEQKMASEDGSLQAFIVGPNIPHLIQNRSATGMATMQVWSSAICVPIPLTGDNSLI